MGMPIEQFLGKPVTEDLNEAGERFLVTEEMIGTVKFFQDTVQGIMIELGIPMDQWRPEQHLEDSHAPIDPETGWSLFGGTTDFIAWGNGCLLIADLKYGAQPVSAESPQLDEYAILALLTLPPEIVQSTQRVVKVIIQPRISFGETVGKSETTPAALQTMYHELWARMQMYVQYQNEPDFPPEMHVPGDHCQYCPKTAKCPALAKLAGEADAALRANAVDMISADNLDFLTYWSDRAEAIGAFLKEVNTQLWKLAQNGTKIPGKKLVYSFGNRQWNVPPAKVREGQKSQPLTGDARAIAVLSKKLGIPANDLKTVKCLSPNKVEEILRAKKEWKEKKETFDTFVSREIRGLRLVDESAKGEEVSLDTGKDFIDAIQFETEGP